MPRSAQQPNITTSTISVSSTTLSTPNIRASKRIRESSAASTATSTGIDNGVGTPTPRSKRTRQSLAPGVATPSGSASGREEGSAKKMRTTKTQDGDNLWSDELDEALKKGLALIPYMGKRTIYFEGDDESYGRNGLLAEYLRRQTGKLRNRVQVASHCAVWKKNNKYDAELLGLIRGHDVPFTELATIDYNALLGPDLHPETLALARAQAKAKRMKAFGLEDSDDEEAAAAKKAETDELESSGLSSTDEAQKSAQKKKRGRPSLAASSTPAKSRLSSRRSLAATSSAAEAATTDDEEKPRRGGRKSLAASNAVPTPQRRSARRSLAPASSAANTDASDVEGAPTPRKGKAKKTEDAEDVVPPVPALPSNIADAAAPSTSFASSSLGTAVPSFSPAPPPVLGASTSEEDTPMEDAPAKPVDPLTTEVVPAAGQLNLARVSSAHSEAEVHAEAQRQQGGGGGWFGGIRRGVWRALGY
ncbi:hypothetical protein JCM6882_007383 [Rhodosporidiobolus microsporus]